MKTTGCQVWTVRGVVLHFPTELLQQILNLLYHMQSGIGMEENYTINKMTRTFSPNGLASFSAWSSTLPADGVTLNFLFLGDPESSHSMVECLLVGMKLWTHVSSPATTWQTVNSLCCTVLQGSEKDHHSCHFVIC